MLLARRAHVGVQGAQSVGRYPRQVVRRVLDYARVYAVQIVRTNLKRALLCGVECEEQLGDEQGEIVRFRVLRRRWGDDEAISAARARASVCDSQAHVQLGAQDEGARRLKTHNGATMFCVFDVCERGVRRRMTTKHLGNASTVSL